MARRRTHAEAARTHMVTVRLTPEAYAQLTADATKLGLTRAGYLDHLASNRKVEAASSDDGSLSIPLINHLKRLGNNLNQVTHAINSGLPAPVLLAAKTLHDLIQLLLEHELTGRQLKSFLSQRTATDDPPPPSKRDELQRSLRLRFARRVES